MAIACHPEFKGRIRSVSDQRRKRRDRCYSCRLAVSRRHGARPIEARQTTDGRQICPRNGNTRRRGPGRAGSRRDDERIEGTATSRTTCDDLDMASSKGRQHQRPAGRNDQERLFGYGIHNVPPRDLPPLQLVQEIRPHISGFSAAQTARIRASTDSLVPRCGRCDCAPLQKRHSNLQRIATGRENRAHHVTSPLISFHPADCFGYIHRSRADGQADFAPFPSSNALHEAPSSVSLRLRSRPFHAHGFRRQLVGGDGLRAISFRHLQRQRRQDGGSKWQGQGRQRL